MRFVYPAKRNLATGHVVDTTYEIVVFGEVIDPTTKIKRTDAESLDGTEEAEFGYIKTEWNVRTDLIAIGQETENFNEFIHSVAGGPGEPFTFDPGSDQLGVDVDAQLVYLASKSVKEARPVPGFKQYAFKMRVATP